eukprot:m.63254 g.63254  ORF g.63254 m.63254 type:complete len:56 (+) comp13436_c0_seq1:630-797(+)
MRSQQIQELWLSEPINDLYRSIFLLRISSTGPSMRSKVSRSSLTHLTSPFAVTVA